MNNMEEMIAQNRNMLYFNQLVNGERKTDDQKPVTDESNKKKSFANKKVELRDFAPVPEGWENFVYAFYAIALPYILGATFLFLFVAGGRLDNFMLLDLNAFPIVWLIGYEILSVIMLCWILVMYLQYEDEERFY